MVISPLQQLLLSVLRRRSCDLYSVSAFGDHKKEEYNTCRTCVK